jgi:hypothetical protein
MAKAPRERTNSPTELAGFAGVSRQTVYDWMRLPGFPRAPDGSVAKWDLCEWYLTRLDPAEDESDEPGRGDSPGLERYRLARAAQEEIKLGEMKKAFIDRQWVHANLMELASLIRACGEQLQREYGEDALAILDQAIKEFKGKIDEWNIDEQCET